MLLRNALPRFLSDPFSPCWDDFSRKIKFGLPCTKLWLVQIGSMGISIIKPFFLLAFLILPMRCETQRLVWQADSVGWRDYNLGGLFMSITGRCIRLSLSLSFCSLFSLSVTHPSCHSLCWSVMSFWKSVSCLCGAQYVDAQVCEQVFGLLSMLVNWCVGGHKASCTSFCKCVGQYLTWWYTFGFDGYWVRWCVGYVSLLVGSSDRLAACKPKITLHYKKRRGLLWQSMCFTGTSEKIKWDPVITPRHCTAVYTPKISRVEVSESVFGKKKWDRCISTLHSSTYYSNWNSWIIFFLLYL